MDFHCPDRRPLLSRGVAKSVEKGRHSWRVTRAELVDKGLVAISQRCHRHFCPSERDIGRGVVSGNSPRVGSILLARIMSQKYFDLAGCTLSAICGVVPIWSPDDGDHPSAEPKDAQRGNSLVQVEGYLHRHAAAAAIRRGTKCTCRGKAAKRPCDGNHSGNGCYRFSLFLTWPPSRKRPGKENGPLPVRNGLGASPAVRRACHIES
jgi:hypothetical protein